MEDLSNIIYPGNDKIAPPILNVEVPRFPLSKGLMQKIQFSPVIEFPGNALRGEHSCTGDGGTWAILAHASGIDDQLTWRQFGHKLVVLTWILIQYVVYFHRRRQLLHYCAQFVQSKLIAADYDQPLRPVASVGLP